MPDGWSISGDTDAGGINEYMMDACCRENPGTGFHSGACCIDIIYKKNGVKSTYLLPVERIQGESLSEICEPGLWTELLLGKCVNGTQQQVTATGQMHLQCKTDT